MENIIARDDLMKNNSAKEQYTRLTQTLIKRLIISLSVPTVISMMTTMIYNAADTFFVSKIGVSASGATGVVFSLMGLIQAFGFMFGQGAGSCISRSLGEKKIDSARQYCSTAIALSLIVSFAFMALGIIFLTPLMKVLGSTDTILPYAKKYALYILIAAPALTTSCVMNNIIRYEGMARLAMIGLVTGGILNIILDPLLIFVFDMGISGAGLATAVSQYISMFILLSVFLMKKIQCRISFKYVKLNGKMIWNIVSTGVPSFARQGLNSFSTMLLNVSAAAYGDSCIAAMSIVSKCSMLIFSVGVGIGQGFQPVSSFNYGAKNYARVYKATTFTWLFDTIVVSSLATVMFAFADNVVGMFRSESEIIEIGSASLRYLCVALVCLPTIMIANMLFQSVGKTGRAFFLACAQNGLFFIPLILILPKFLGVTGIELAQPLSNIVSAIVAIPFLLAFLKQLKNKSNQINKQC